MDSFKYVIGIDEAGRGPLAGPVSVGVVCVRPGFDWNVLPGVDDSKKLSEKKRVSIFEQAELLQKKHELAFAVGLTNAQLIDTMGIVPAIRSAMDQALNEVQRQCNFLPEECRVKLDGSLKAPATFLFQETIIHGDAKEKVIGLASIMAKVTRDRLMNTISKDPSYQMYQFDQHKGYGTKVHRLSILEYGLSDMHRQSFCRKLMDRNTVV